MVVPSIKQEEKRFGQKDAEGHSGEVQFEMLVGHPLRLTKVAVGDVDLELRKRGLRCMCRSGSY